MNLKEVKNKISVINNINQITHALELVAAVKMRKAQRIAVQSRHFSHKAVEILYRLAKYQQLLKEKSPLLKEGSGEKILAVVVASDKGFCGAFNKNILNFSEKYIKKLGKSLDVIAIGKKAIRFFQKKNYSVVNQFSKIGDWIDFSQVRFLADTILKLFESGSYNKILLFYTDFTSTILQEPRMVQVLPLDLNTIGEILAVYDLKDSNNTGGELPKGDLSYILEPSPEEIFKELVPQFIEFEIYHCILEANASEHSARMMAMKSASSNAKDLIERLTLEYNKARQAQITSELAEISIAKESME